MAMLTRLTRLFRADLHAVLDRIEEPELLLRQSLREMEEALDEATRVVHQNRQQREALSRRQQEVSASLSVHGEELQLSLDADNEALARILLRRRLEGERLLAQLLGQTSMLDATIIQREREVSQQRAQLEQVRQQARSVAPPPDAAPMSGDAWSAEQLVVTDADVELALLRARRSRA